jgi:hypothetical protein
MARTLSVSLTALILLATLSFANFTIASGATTATFGNTSVGTQSARFSTNKDASRFQLSESGELQSITAYFANSGFNAKAAIYADNNGVPDKLLTQSSSQQVAVSGWKTFAVPQKSLSPGNYWLAVVSSRTRASGRAIATSQANQHCVKSVTAYSSEFASSFGSPYRYDSLSTCIYATYVPVAPITTNLMQNGGFESGTSPWTVATSGTGYAGTLTTSTDAYAGSYCGLFRVTGYPTGTQTGYITVAQSLQVEAGKTYTFEFFYKGTMTVFPHVFCFDAAWQRLALFSGPTCQPIGGWTFISMSLGPIPQGTVVTQIHFDVASTGALQVDNVVLKQIDNSVAAPRQSFGVYWDNGGINKVSSIDWGILSPGTTKTMTLYIRNEGNVPILLSKQMLNWNPTNTATVLTLDWDYNNQLISAGNTLKVTLSLNVAQNIPGIDGFNVDAVLTATS